MKNIGSDRHDDTWYEQRIDYLSQFILPERFDTFRRVLDMRTRRITICTENTFHPQNASALIRTCEAFGIQEVHTVEAVCRFNPNVRIVRGSDKWIDIHSHPSTTDALERFRAAGYRIVATTPHGKGDTPESLDLSSPIALIFGTEHAGVSPEVIAAADTFVRIPMCGFVESLNVSASAAILLHVLTHRLRTSDIEWHLGESDRYRILFRWLMTSIRDSERILEKMEL